MVFDKIFIPCHVSVNHIKMGSRTAKAYHGLFIVSSKSRTDRKKDDPWNFHLDSDGEIENGLAKSQSLPLVNS